MDCSPYITTFDFITHTSNLVLDNYALHGISPDGSKWLVSQGKQLFVTDLDGSNPVLLSSSLDVGRGKGGFTAYWIPEIDTIVFRGVEDKKIRYFAIQPDGKGLKAVTPSRYGAISSLPVLYDEGIFWEEGKTDSRNYFSYGWRWTKLDGSETKKLDLHDPIISPDGRFVIYQSINSIVDGPPSFTISANDGSKSSHDQIN